MNPKIHSIAFHGSQCSSVTIECCHARGFAGIQGLGLHIETVKSIREKVTTVLERSQLKMSAKKIILSCSPAESHFNSHFDLPAAIALFALHTTSKIRANLEEIYCAGELSLNGGIKPVLRIVPLVLEAQAQGAKVLILPKENQHELAALRQIPGAHQDMKILHFENLSEIIAWLNGSQDPQEVITPPAGICSSDTVSFDDMQLTPKLKTIITTVILGMHNLFLRGTPGTGKSMLSQRLPSLMPLLEPKQHLDVLKIHSLSERSIPSRLLAGRAPFRSPHHLGSAQGIIGTPDLPGDISLAHGGILFLDELPEYRRDLLEGLREPLETGEIQVSRAQKKKVWPGQFLLVAAANNCPCGWLGSRRRLCQCLQQSITRYQQKLSGPLMDRIDIHLTMDEPNEDQLSLLGATSFQGQTLEMKKKIDSARAWSKHRHDRLGVRANGQIPAHQILTECRFLSGEESQAVTKLQRALPTRRSQVRALRVARTIADLERRENVTLEDVKLALELQHHQR
ncbi:YifB family Mg chelatase-like AAA ATPase [Pseudobacteriovorax antillogorgiicola]|uniref:Magnesium chelatase family protein n=1 Tax=Pseudobacteriovorax antillogorgiicola TaxID=1513793 RepID=A0A1Y6CGS9_9BACT|nr:ATP-binding protein [Pseudobacteriovorax antillogorgiicola]TCS48699.1 magnesium chelatase family protein [Pseudobacteriovorax antillogorgiicola]SMF54732.1 magnesium chelatase family protein [Pseudobacteriovorax antillogorgiicola]